jgi:hypothetical protein
MLNTWRAITGSRSAAGSLELFPPLATSLLDSAQKNIATSNNNPFLHDLHHIFLFEKNIPDPHHILILDYIGFVFYPF